MAGGTQNRNAQVAYDTHLLNVGKKKECGCPIHKRDGKKTFVDATLFNRSKESGLQSMCRIGKKMLDSYKHKMNAWKLVYLFDKFNNSKCMQELEGNFKCAKSSLIYNDFNLILDKIYNKLSNEIKDETKLFFELMSDIDSLIGNRRNSLLIQIKIYDSNLTIEEFDMMIDDANVEKNLSATQRENIINFHDDMCDKLNVFLIDSADKKINHHSMFRTDWGKIHPAFDESGEKLLNRNGEQIRLNKWNTLAKGNTDSRVERYFPDGDYKAANAEMAKINNTNFSADHIWPISLGGRHDVKNLEPMILSDNIKKRNNLSIELVNRVLQDPSKHISGRYLAFFESVCTGEVNEETIVELERGLKLEVEKWSNDIKTLDQVNKEARITGYLLEHGYRHDKMERIIKKYFS